MVAEFILFVAIFVGIMLICSLIFGGWVLSMIFRGVASMLGLNSTPNGNRRPSGAVRIGPLDSARLCNFDLCRSPNEPGARFCRRCGRPLASAQRVRTRRAAMW